MRLATWNVNSAKIRLPRLLPWLDKRQPDVLCLQETKLSDEDFDGLLGSELARRGYAVARHGEGRWNGVAILSRVGLDGVSVGLPAEPTFAGELQARAIAATCAGARVYSVYAPNGRALGDPHYDYKLEWYAALQAALGTEPPPVVCGDMNVAPADADVFDPAAFAESTHVTPAERAAFGALVDLGLHDVLRERWPTQRVFTYWDYRAGMFPKDLGMRIDHVLAASSVAERVRAVWVDREARKGRMPSDHAPVIVDLDSAPDGDIGPVVPPPSTPEPLPHF